MKSLFVATTIAAAIAVSPAAHARDWWMLNAQYAKCDPANDFPPADLVAAQRQLGKAPVVNVQRDDNGNVIGAYITVDDTYWTYTTTRSLCQAVLLDEIKKGNVVPPSELR